MPATTANGANPCFYSIKSAQKVYSNNQKKSSTSIKRCCWV